MVDIVNMRNYDPNILLLMKHEIKENMLILQKEYDKIDEILFLNTYKDLEIVKNEKQDVPPNKDIFISRKKIFPSFYHRCILCNNKFHSKKELRDHKNVEHSY